MKSNCTFCCSEKIELSAAADIRAAFRRNSGNYGGVFVVVFFSFTLFGSRDVTEDIKETSIFFQ